MKFLKVKIAIFVLLISIGAGAQTGAFNNVSVKNSLVLKAQKVTDISKDSSVNSKSSGKLITEKAAKNYADTLFKNAQGASANPYTADGNFTNNRVMGDGSKDVSVIANNLTLNSNQDWYGESASGSVTLNSGSNNAQLIVSEPDKRVYIGSSDSIFLKAYNKIRLTANPNGNISHVTLNSAGNLGINNANPLYKLDVIGSARLAVGGTTSGYDSRQSLSLNNDGQVVSRFTSKMYTGLVTPNPTANYTVPQLFQGDWIITLVEPPISNVTITLPPAGTSGSFSNAGRELKIINKVLAGSTYNWQIAVAGGGFVSGALDDPPFPLTNFPPGIITLYSNGLGWLIIDVHN